MYQMTASAFALSIQSNCRQPFSDFIFVFKLNTEKCPSISVLLCSLSAGLRSIYRVSVASDCAGCRVFCVLLMSAHSV